MGVGFSATCPHAFSISASYLPTILSLQKSHPRGYDTDKARAGFLTSLTRKSHESNGCHRTGNAGRLGEVSITSQPERPLTELTRPAGWWATVDEGRTARSGRPR